MGGGGGRSTLTWKRLGECCRCSGAGSCVCVWGGGGLCFAQRSEFTGALAQFARNYGASILAQRAGDSQRAADAGDLHPDATGGSLAPRLKAARLITHEATHTVCSCRAALCHWL